MLSLAGAVLAVALTITTQNVRQGLPPDQARHDIHQAAEHSSIVLTQEMGTRHARSFAPAGWGTAHRAGRMRGDCATYWQRSTWDLRRAWLVPLTLAPFRNGHRWALVTVLRGQHTSLALVCLHMITGGTQPARAPVYAAGMRRLAALTVRLHSHWPHVLVGGDWNMPRAGTRLPHMLTRQRSLATGPHGGRIDYVRWWRGQFTYQGARVIGQTFSDHQGFRTHLRLR